MIDERPGASLPLTMIGSDATACHRWKAFSVRYFLGFTVSGFVVPMMALLHGSGGFALVLGVAPAFGAVVVASAALSTGSPTRTRKGLLS